ncbi:MAG: tyrosine-type recombinase/integrase [Acidimicrobiales bacterium]|nr:tyrosine-type recombinase/integrase [Acidimicrobiales bacterium]
MRSSPPGSPPPAEAGDGPVPAFLRSRSGGSTATVDTYRRRLARYVEWNHGTEIDRNRYDSYVAKLKRDGRQPNGIALDAQVLLLFAEHMDISTKGWQRPRSREVAVAWLRDAELEALRRALADSECDGPDRVFAVDFLRGTGLRLGEFLALRWRDVDMEEGLVTVRSGKGGKLRVVAVPWDGPPAGVRAIEGATAAFWRRHPERTLAEARAVTGPVAPWRRQWEVHNWLRAGALRAGLGGVAVHPHLFRHGYTLDLVMRGVPLPVVQRLLGHSSLRTTSRYAQVTPVDIVEALRKAA